MTSVRFQIQILLNKNLKYNIPGDFCKSIKIPYDSVRYICLARLSLDSSLYALQQSIYFQAYDILYMCVQFVTYYNIINVNCFRYTVRVQFGRRRIRNNIVGVGRDHHRLLVSDYVEERAHMRLFFVSIANEIRFWSIRIHRIIFSTIYLSFYRYVYDNIITITTTII